MPESPNNEGHGVRIIAGLGNPGREFVGTRHNIGFAVLDRLATLLGATFSKETKWDAHMARVQEPEAILMKPTTFMNLSGEAVNEYAQFHRVPAASTLVVLDDVSLPLGTLRLRREGSSGGQKGLESVLIHFATEAVPRLRVGVGGASGDLSSHVLSRFDEAEREAAENATLRAAEAALCVMRQGMEAAMNLYNATPSSDKPQETTANTP